MLYPNIKRYRIGRRQVGWLYLHLECTQGQAEGCSFPWQNKPLDYWVGQKESKCDVQQVGRLKCELIFGGSGNESKDTIKAGKWQKEGFAQGFSLSLAQRAVSQGDTESGSVKSKSEGTCWKGSIV